jgi:hypothetical protein
MVAAIGEIVRNGVMFDMKNWGKKLLIQKAFLIRDASIASVFMSQM